MQEYDLFPFWEFALIFRCYKYGSFGECTGNEDGLAQRLSTSVTFFYKFPTVLHLESELTLTSSICFSYQQLHVHLEGTNGDVRHPPRDDVISAIGAAKMVTNDISYKMCLVKTGGVAPNCGPYFWKGFLNPPMLRFLNPPAPWLAPDSKHQLDLARSFLVTCLKGNVTYLHVSRVCLWHTQRL